MAANTFSPTMSRVSVVERRQRHQEIELARDFDKIVALHHAVEAGRWRAGVPLMPITVMPKRLADRRQIFRDQPDAENADGLAGEQLRRPALPLRASSCARAARGRSRASDSM